ncbi:MAG: HTH domain-containing protein [Galbibacter orientalis]
MKKFGESSGKIIGLLLENENSTASEIAEIISISTRAVEKQLAKLKKTGVIDRVGPDKGGYWKVNL